MISTWTKNGNTNEQSGQEFVNQRPVASFFCRGHRRIVLSPAGLKSHSALFVRIDVELAVKAFAQVENDHAVDMKVVATAGTGGNRRQEGDNKEQNKPDSEHHTHGPVRRGNGVGYPQGGYVDQNGSEEKFSPPAKPVQCRPECSCIAMLSVAHGQGYSLSKVAAPLLGPGARYGFHP